VNYEWPPTPDVVPAVLARIEGRPRPSRRRLALVIALVVLVPAGGALAVPGVRRWLGLEHVRIQRVPGPAPPPAQRVAPEFGARVTVAEAGRRAGFAVFVPPRLGRPRAVRERDGVVTLIYGRLRLTEVRGDLDRAVLEKTLFGSNRVRRVPHGVFIRGRHFYAYLDEHGQAVGTQTSAARTLVIERGGLVLRLENARLRAARRLIAP
jgi:hypothetical protein